MDINGLDSGGRVTRSLRKRLTSVDVDNTSRPGTPTTKLTSITEMSASPSKSTRSTRRNSVSTVATPVKTPAKRAVNNLAIAENSETPISVKSTRSRNVLTDENHTGLQIATNEVLDKIIPENKKQAEIGRSESRSPQQENHTPKSCGSEKANISADNRNGTEGNTKTPAGRKRKPGPKSKTYEYGEFDDTTDVEVNVFECESRDVKYDKSNTPIVLSDDSNPVPNIQKKYFEGHEADYSKPCSPINRDVASTNTSTMCVENNFIDTERNSDTVKDLQIDENIGHKNIPDEHRNNSQLEEIEKHEQKLQACNDNNRGETVSEHDKSEIKNEASFLEVSINEDSNNFSTSDGKKKTSKEENSNEKEEFIRDNFNDPATPEREEAPEKVEILSVSTTKYGLQEVQKMVDFISSPSVDSSMKIVYPKTPASTKASATSKKLQLSLENDSENQEMQMTEHKTPPNSPDAGFQITQTKTLKSDCESFRTSEIIQSPIPTNEHDLKIVDDNKMVVIDEQPANVLENSPCCKEIVIFNASKNAKLENYINRSQNQDEGELKWINPSSKGNTGEGSKLDLVSTYANASGNNIEDEIAKCEPDTKKNTFSSNDDQKDENDEEYTRKHDYIDDEAMEVGNYVSGDSMDSQERMEIELNEIPVDEESIGCQTTSEDEYVEDEDSGNSFIVSDSEKVENYKSDNNDDLDEYATEPKHKTNKKLYRRIQRQFESSSSSDEVEEPKLNNCHISENDAGYQKSIQDPINIQKEKSPTVYQKEKDFDNSLNSFKCQTKTNESLSEQVSSSKSCNSIILDSSKLSDSALRLHYTSYSKSEEEDNEENISRKEILSEYSHSQRLNKSVRDLNLELDEAPKEYHDNLKEQLENLSPEKDIQSKSQLGEKSVTTESADRKSGSGLNVSLSNFKTTEEEIECQKSFTIDVETKLTNAKSRENELHDLSSSNNGENKEIENKQTSVEWVENKRHIPLSLGNPLIRTRRQSLALPTNPDKEIYSNSNSGISNKKIPRKSLGVMSNIDFKPSQSFIEHIELLKIEQNRGSIKRKRLSKSFCGSTEAHDNSIVDINVHSIHKRSKLADETIHESSDQEYKKQIDSTEMFKQISSTPHEKIKTNDSNNKRILARCDEILEAAKQAKLEAKIKKIKTEAPKKWKKKPVFTSSEEISPVDKVARSIPSETKCKDKTTAILQAFMASNAILNKSKMSTLNKVCSEEKSLGSDVIESARKTVPTKKKSGKDTENICVTSAGNFMEFPQTPEKKKKVKYIKLPTGKVSVEPITPKKSLVQALNGRSFRESPLTPCGVGFRAKKMNSAENNMSSPTILKTGKRKRCLDKSFKNIARPNTQWTQSGLFKEEVILNRNISSKITKQRQERKQNNVPQNFKEAALSRPGINRSTKRELLMINTRKRACATTINSI